MPTPHRTQGNEVTAGEGVGRQGTEGLLGHCSLTLDLFLW